MNRPAHPEIPLDEARAGLEALLEGGGARLALDPDRVERDLAQLVLGLMEFLRQLTERQAIRRMQSGTLTAAEEERVGATLMRAETALHDLAGRFGLTSEDLSIDLGPLGRTF